MLIHQKLAAIVVCGFAVSSAYASEQEQINLLPLRIQEFCQRNDNECKALLDAMQDKKNCMNGVIKKEAFTVAKKAHCSDETADGISKYVAHNSTVSRKPFGYRLLEYFNY